MLRVDSMDVHIQRGTLLHTKTEGSEQKATKHHTHKTKHKNTRITHAQAGNEALTCSQQCYQWIPWVYTYREAPYCTQRQKEVNKRLQSTTHTKPNTKTHE